MNHTTRRVAALTATLITAAVLASCSTGDPESDTPAGAEVTAGTPAAEVPVEGEAPPEVEVGYTREQPYQPGDTFLFGEWELTVGETTDATKKVMDYQDESWGGDEEYMTPPDDGNVYVSMPINFTYKGEDRGDPGYGLTIALVTADGNTFDEIQMIDTPPDSNMNIGELYTDASGKGYFYMEVPEGAIDEAVWRITENFMDSMAGEVYVATE